MHYKESREKREVAEFLQGLHLKYKKNQVYKRLEVSKFTSKPTVKYTIQKQY